jgi:hypothetical protein
MSIERTYYCEGPGCHGHDPEDAETPSPLHTRTFTPPPHLPIGFVETRQRLNGRDYLRHFCSWDCVMKFAAKQPIPEVVE